MDPNCPTFSEFFETENALSEEIAKTCEGVMSVQECELALKATENNKTPGTDGLTPEENIEYVVPKRPLHRWQDKYN